MATTKQIDLFLNFQKDTPDDIIESLKSIFIDGEPSFLTSGYRHPSGKPHFEFYLDDDRPEDYKVGDGTYYLRYINTIKDYDNKFELWLSKLAPYLIQCNGYHIGTIVNADTNSLTLVSMCDRCIVYTPMIPSC